MPDGEEDILYFKSCSRFMGITEKFTINNNYNKNEGKIIMMQ